jgi:hypothetical protein
VTGLVLAVAVACHGHTALTWDPYVNDPQYPAAYFEVERSVGGLNVWSVAGDTREKDRAAVDEIVIRNNTTGAVTRVSVTVPWTCPAGHTCTFSMRLAPAYRAQLWDLLRAWSLPVEGVHYDYRVRAVGTTGLKSGPSNVVNCGPQDPTWVRP